jgi:hypothetical protein
MTIEVKQVLDKLFNKYLAASDVVEKVDMKILEAKMHGQAAMANYLENQIYPKLQKKAYRAICDLEQTVEKLILTNNKNGRRAA